MQATTVSLEELHRFASAVLEACGCPPGDAAVGAEVLCFADARGFSTHGVAALAGIFVPALRAGRIDASARAVALDGSPGAVAIDGRRALGLVTARRATDLAVERAREHGACVAVVRNSTHLGCLSAYTARAAAAGMVALAATNCGAQGVVPPLGGAVRLLGTNPISAAVPADGAPPFVLDMSTTTVAAGKVKAAWRAGEPVPAGWIARRDGTPTTDPGDYVDGEAHLTWLGGRLDTGAAKGFGLGVLVDLLCGPLAGAAWGPHAAALAAPRDDDDIGHVVMAIDPDALGGRAVLAARAGELLSTLAGSPPAPGSERVTYPGQMEAEREAAARRDGVALAPEVARALRELAGELGVAPV